MTKDPSARSSRGPSPIPSGTPKIRESDLETILTHCTDVFVVYDAELRYTFINQAGAGLLGKKVEDVIGRTNREIMGPGAHAIEPHVRRSFEERRRVFVVHEIELPGETRIFDTVYNPVLGEAGEVERVVGVCRDVTDDHSRIQRLEGLVQKRTEHLEQANKMCRMESEAHRETAEALEESEGRYRELADSITDLFFAVDQDLRVTYWNRAAEDLTGRRSGEAVGRSAFKLLPWIQGTPLEELFRQVQEARHSETLVQTAAINGENRSFEFHAYPSSSGGLSVFGRDITTRIRQEHERERLQDTLQSSRRTEAIATLAGGMAHRFNNALSAVMGNLDLLNMDLLDLDAGTRKALGRYVQQMEESLEHMEFLTRQLLAYAQGGRYSPTAVSVGTFVRYTLPLLGHTIDPLIRLETDLAAELRSVEADTTQLQMLLAAVVQNACEAIAGEGTIRISARNVHFTEDDDERPPKLEPGPYVLLTVQDDGQGMDPETLERLFEPFFSTRLQGRGLGMAAAYGIVRNHGGWISARSEPGLGTTLSIWLPALEDREQKPAPAQKPAKQGMATVLVVEDERAVLEVFRVVLKRMGYRVLAAPTGQEAVETARSYPGPIDLAILDILLPDTDGRSVYPKLMQARPDLKVIVTSGYSIEGPAQEILDAGAEAFLPKPFSLQDFREMLAHVMGDAPSIKGPAP